MNGFFFIARSKFNVPILRFRSGNLLILHSICTLNCCNLNSSESARSNRNPLDALKIVSHFVNDEKKNSKLTVEVPLSMFHLHFYGIVVGKTTIKMCDLTQENSRNFAPSMQFNGNRTDCNSWEKQINFLMEIRRQIKATRFNFVFYIFLFETPPFALRISKYQMAMSYMSFEYFFFIEFHSI